MPQKLFRDPLYDYISLDKGSWLLQLVNTPEIQRLRYINQLGLSHFTYPGATHSRLSHSMGTLHLVGQWLACLKRDYASCMEDGDKDALLAATLLHDIGHGPFSHATEDFFGEHEARSVEIVMNPESSVNKVLSDVDSELPARVAGLVAKKLPDGAVQPRLWQKSLISSQLDVDRLDFLRRDSLFSGAEYGNFDWYRILHTTEIKEYDGAPQKTHLFWPDKTAYAIEEYLFSRFYMYQSVYYHHTTRGFEKLILKILERAKWLVAQDQEFQARMLPTLRVFFQPKNHPPTGQFVSLTDYILLAQILEWKKEKDPILSDLASKFFIRGDTGFKVAREFDYTRKLPMMTKILQKVSAAGEYLKKNGLDPHYYLLADEFDVPIYKPYFPELEGEEMSPHNVIMLAADSTGTNIREISSVLPRLQPIAKDPHIARYYCPHDSKETIRRLLS